MSKWKHVLTFDPDPILRAEYDMSMEGIDQTYIQWLETQLKVAREFQRRFEAMELLCIKHGIDTSEVRK